MKDRIPTAEEFLEEKLNEESFYILKKYFDTSIEGKMIEFAKLHLEACKKEMIKEITKDYSNISSIEHAILNSYLNKIK